MKILNNLTIPTVAEIGLIVSSLMPALIYILAKIFEVRKYKSSIAKEEAEAEKISAEKKKVEAEARETEARVTMSYINSANSLVTEYKEMLEALNQKYSALEERLNSTEKRLDAEIKRRKDGEKVALELVNGLKILLKQLDECEIKPAWKPGEHLNKTLNRLEGEYTETPQDQS